MPTLFPLFMYMWLTCAVWYQVGMLKRDPSLGRGEAVRIFPLHSSLPTESQVSSRRHSNHPLFAQSSQPSPEVPISSLPAFPLTPLPSLPGGVACRVPPHAVGSDQGGGIDQHRRDFHHGRGRRACHRCRARQGDGVRHHTYILTHSQRNTSQWKHTHWRTHRFH